MEQLLDIAKFDSYKRRQPSGSEEGERGDCRCPYGIPIRPLPIVMAESLSLAGGREAACPIYCRAGEERMGRTPNRGKIR